MGTRERRPGQISSTRMGTYADYTAARVVADPDAAADPDEIRADYVAWCSDRFAKPEPRSKQRAAMRDAGGTPKGTGDALRYLGLRLVGPIPDSGYRVALRAVGPRRAQELRPALDALAAAGLIADLVQVATTPGATCPGPPQQRSSTP